MQPSQDDLWLTVGEVARHAGLSVRTLHHYDQRGLLVPSGRSASDYRLYSPEDLQRLLQIQHLKSLGLGLDEVSAALDADDFDAREVLEEHIAAVEQRLADETRMLRTLRGLRQSASTGWQEVLSAVAQSERLRHPEAHVRFRAALDSTSGLPLEALVAQLVEDPAPGVREVLTWAIARHGHAARDALIPLLTHPDPVVRAQAAHALSKVGDASVAPFVVPLLRDDDVVVASKAAQVLGRFGGHAALTALVGILGDGPDVVGDAVVAALEEVGPSAVAPLVARLGDPAALVRSRAAEALGLVGVADAAEHLAPLVHDDDPSVRFEAIVALGQLAGDAAEAAIEGAQGSPDDRLRHIAARLLRDRRATPQR
ncbi:HEAT repeat domain-containing protein [Tessaracoccus antarcticus]|uniref:MerR family transcriptional regulator n=1 Tax=Tessaracoccus antarcticus TaxID=2479848 RepID=A0A3M0GB76_9ACTN|nr:HEAT repeat domain-containing protein [Tessaracoccus antarcticus]RMB62180.1 MerR family transcriptional regulator [Tessaracoccus antarcticus]